MLRVYTNRYNEIYKIKTVCNAGKATVEHFYVNININIVFSKVIAFFIKSFLFTGVFLNKLSLLIKLKKYLSKEFLIFYNSFL